MKAERRHELQTNSLAQALQNFPQLMQQYGTKILLAITLIVLLIVLLQYRARTVEQQALTLQQQLSGARAAIAEIRQPDGRLPMDRIAAHRQQLANETEASLNDVLENAESPQMRAEALLARGDLYWAQATAPQFPTTQPAAQPQRTTDDLYRSAQAAYEQVVRDYSDQPRSRIAAMFGLAAIAENQHNWQAAAEQYNAIIAAADLAMYRELAQRRRDSLEQLKEPLYIGQAILPTTEPATQEATTQEATTTPATPPVESEAPTTSEPQAAP